LAEQLTFACDGSGLNLLSSDTPEALEAVQMLAESLHSMMSVVI